MRAGQAERERRLARAMGREAPEIGEPEAARLAAKRVHRGGGPSVTEGAVVDRRLPCEPEPIPPRRRSRRLELEGDMGAEQAGAHGRHCTPRSPLRNR